jgi:putative nucleotidyltransferase with HDIG domain
VWDLDSGEDLLALGVLVVSFYAFSALPAALSVALAQRRPILHILSENIQPVYMDFSGTVLFGVLSGFVWYYQPKLGIILLALGVVIYRAFQLATRLTHETEVALKTIVDVVDERDTYTFNHSLLVARYSRLMAERMGCDPSDVDLIERAAYLHDIGKVGIADESLQKRSQLSEAEFERMKLHPEIGARILGSFSQFHAGVEIVLSHQEWYDGSGYPRGLRGEQIPLGARIIAVADAYVAMTTDRPYRKAMAKEQALIELRQAIGAQFDPLVCATFIKLVLESPHLFGDQVVEMRRLRELRDSAAEV